MTSRSVVICVSPEAGKLESFAAQELQRYLETLFGVSAEITTASGEAAHVRFVLGLKGQAHVERAAGGMPDLGEQGHLLRRVSGDTMVLAGGSPAALCWAVYELVERYEVRYLLHEDVFPETPGAFHLPAIDDILEPIHRTRVWRLIRDMPNGSVAWSLAEQKAVMNQVFKLKFNAVSLGFAPSCPVIEYEVLGVRRTTGAMNYGLRIPIDEDTIGLEHLAGLYRDDAPYLAMPEFVGAESFAEMRDALRRLMHGMIDHAKGLGMRIMLGLNPLEFPIEFRPLLENPSHKHIQLGDLTCCEQGDLMNANHVALVRAKFEAFLDEYGHVDQLGFGFPEFPQAEANSRECYRDLSEKYGFRGDYDLDELLASTREALLMTREQERAERSFKSSIVMLDFYDRFFARTGLLRRMADLNVRPCLGISTHGSYETLNFIDRVLPEGAALAVGDYASSRLVRKLHYLEAIDASRIPVFMIVTLQDDNIGAHPQITTESMHILLQAAHRLGWEGFYMRFWPIGDLDPMMAYLAKASWDVSVTPRHAYEDHFRLVYGDASVEPLCQVVRMLEDATTLLEVEPGGNLFPVPGIMRHHVTADSPAPDPLSHVRALYEEVRHILARLRDLPGSAVRASNLDYWISRMTFAAEVLSEIDLLHKAGVEVHQAARECADADVSRKHIARARELYDRAVAAGAAAVTAAASEVRDSSDRGGIAAYYHLLVREVRQFVDDYTKKRCQEPFPE